MPSAVDDTGLLAWGFGHIKMIGENNGEILGRPSIAVDEDGVLSGVSTWGLRYIVALAERVFVDGKPVVR